VRLFVLTLGFSRKSVRLLEFRSSAQIWASIHQRISASRHREAGNYPGGSLGRAEVDHRSGSKSGGEPWIT
jgi:hypothetical protein